jgi:hypothetical protein
MGKATPHAQLTLGVFASWVHQLLGLFGCMLLGWEGKKLQVVGMLLLQRLVGGYVKGCCRWLLMDRV